MAKKAEVIITCDASTVKQVLEGLNREMEKTNQRRQQLQQKQQAGIRLTKAEEKELQQLVKYENALAERQQKATGEMRKFGEVMKDLAGSKTKDLKRALNEGKRALDNMSARDPNRQKLIDDLRQIQKQIEKNTAGMQKFGSTHNAIWQTAIRNITAYMGVFALFNKVKSTLTSLFEKNLEFSDQLTDIRKVSGLTIEEINVLATRLATIDTRSSVQELNKLAYAGSKLGMGQYGVQGLESFVKAANKVNVALKEDLGEDALTAMSKLVEVMGLIPKMGIERSMDAAGSAIFMLSTTSTATGANIIEFSKRMMGLANVSHVATDELLGLASASDAMGLMPEVAATAFNKVFTSIQTNTKEIAKSLGDTNGELQKLIDNGETMKGIVYVLEQMHKMSIEEMKGRGLFKALGSDGARLNNVIATMANRIDMLKSHLDVSNEAFEEGVAIQKEYMMQQESAAGYAERAANIWEKSFVNPEGVDVVKKMAVEWYNVSKSMAESSGQMQMIKTTLTMIGGLVKGLIQVLPILIRLMMFYGITAVIQAIWKNVLALTAALNSASTAAGRLNAVMKANQFAFLATSALLLVSVFYDIASAQDKVIEKQKTLNDFVAEGQAEYAKQKLKVDEYIKALEDENIAQETREKMLRRFNKEFEPYLTRLGVEINSVTDLKNAYSLLNEELQKKAMYELKNRAMEEYLAEPNERVKRDVMAYYEISKQEGVDYMSANDLIAMAQEGKSSFDAMARMIMIRQSAQGKVVKWLGDQYNPYRAFKIYDAQGRTDDKIYSTDNTANAWGSGTERDNGFDPRLFDTINSLFVSAKGMQNTIKMVNEAFEGFDTGWEELLEDFGNNNNYTAGPTKDEIQTAKESLRKDLKDAKAESDAVISKIEEWYRLQETVITDMAADGKLTQEQAEQVIRTLNIAKNTALRDARLAISGRDTKTWEQTKQQIDDLMLDQGKWSQELLQQILNVSMESIRANLARIDAGGGQYGITTTALKDAVDKNAAGNQREIARLMNKGQQEVEKLLLQYHFVEQAVKAFSNRLAQMGILTETAQQMAKQLNDATLKGAINPNAGIAARAVAEAQRIQQEKAKREALTDFVKSGTAPYTVTPEDTESLETWFKTFIRNNEGPYRSWAETFRADFELWEKDSDKYKSDIQAFYFSLLQSEEEYFDARKKAYNKAKKDLEQMWEVSGKGEVFDNVQKQLNLRQRELALTGRDKGQQNMLMNAGFINLGEDPEIAQSILRMEQAQRELEMLRQVNAQKKLEGDELLAHNQLLHEKELALADAQMAMQEQLMKSINERISKLQEWTAPIENFGTEVGKALYDQWHNGESMTAKWQDMLKSLALSWGQLTVKITSELMMQKIKQQLINKAMQVEAASHQATMATIEQTGGQARQVVQQTTGQALVQGQQAVNTTLEVQEQAHNATMLSEDVGQATAENPVNISRAAGKTLANLGWWGIPLVAVVTALLNMLLQAALGSSSKKSETATKTTATAAKTKLVSSMLTFDRGNTDSALGGSAAKKKHRYLGNDGRVYLAEEAPDPKDGLVTHPIATTVQGQPALVAEKGPEIVIGRETTEAIMMNEPELIRYIANYDRHGGKYGLSALRAYDQGTALSGSPAGNTAAVLAASPSGDTLAALTAVVAQLSATVQALQQKGVPAYINKYGTGGLIEEVKSGLKFDKRYNG